MVAGALIEGHIHVKVVRAQSDRPHSGMGLETVRDMFDGYYELVHAALADLGDSEWLEKLRELDERKEKASAFRR